MRNPEPTYAVWPPKDQPARGDELAAHPRATIGPRARAREAGWAAKAGSSGTDGAVRSVTSDGIRDPRLHRSGFEIRPPKPPC